MIQLVPEGADRFVVCTPFQFDDCDCLTIVLKAEDSAWVLSDEGNTYMRLTYDISERDLQRGTRQKIITNALDAYSVEDRDGELILRVDGDRFGDALYDYVQALLRISDVAYLTREQARSTFLDDFRAHLSEVVSEARREQRWSDASRTS
jgi:uncharacterized protein DUF1828